MKYKLFILFFLLSLGFINSDVIAQPVIGKDDSLELNGEWLNDSKTGFYSSLEFDSSTNLVIVKPFFGDKLCYTYKLSGDMLVLDDGIKRYENFIFMKKYEDFMFFSTFLGGKWKTLFYKVTRKIM